MKKLCFLLFFSLFLSANAQTFNFSKPNNSTSNQILKNSISDDLTNEDTEVISYFYDINKDNKNEIIGIIKNQYFYSLAGYKLFFLKENNSTWEIIKSDIYFDDSKDIEIEKNKITYYKTIFYKNKKYNARIKKNKIKTTKTIFDFFKDKKAHNIEEITKFNQNTQRNDFELENFHSQQQKSVNINYTNLNEKTKHYLDLK